MFDVEYEHVQEQMYRRGAGIEEHSDGGFALGFVSVINSKGGLKPCCGKRLQ